MRTIYELLGEYNDNHQNPTNKKIHRICVPLIMFSILGMLYGLSFPGWTKAIFPLFSWSFLLVLICFAYYMLESFPIAIFMLAISLLMLWIQDMLMHNIGCVNLIILNGVIFIIAWIGQLIGHNIEGNKPSFTKDLQFLLIGPAWLLSQVLGKWVKNLDV